MTVCSNKVHHKALRYQSFESLSTYFVKMFGFYRILPIFVERGQVIKPTVNGIFNNIKTKIEQLSLKTCLRIFLVMPWLCKLCWLVWCLPLHNHCITTCVTLRGGVRSVCDGQWPSHVGWACRWYKLGSTVVAKGSSSCRTAMVERSREGCQRSSAEVRRASLSIAETRVRCRAYKWTWILHDFVGLNLMTLILIICQKFWCF